MGGRIRILAYGLFLASGATALLYQLVWIRSLTLVFGASFEAVSIVLGAFMAGLALGGVSIGRLTSRIRRPLRLYGLLEIGVGLFAMVLPYLLAVLERVYVGVAQRSGGVSTWLQLLRLALAFGVLLLPTFCMGGTLPILTRVLVRRFSDFGSRLSSLYAINTAGAVLGTLAAGFVMLPRFGVSATTWIAVSLNLLIGVVAVAADRFWIEEAGDSGEPGPAAPAERDPLPGARAAEAWSWRLAFWGTAVAGLGALSLEVLWSRAISILTGSTTYSATVMLAAFLIGIALGSWLHVAFPLRRIEVPTQFAVVLFLIGLSSFAVSEILPRLPEVALRFNLRVYSGTTGARLGTTLLLSFLVMLVPTLLMGIAFPLAGQARARWKGRLGESVGDVVGLNTAGAILGSLLAGFAIIPFLGVQRGMVLISSLYMFYGLLVFWIRICSRSRSPWPRLATSTALLVFFFPVAIDSWDARLMAAFPNNKTGGFGSDVSADLTGWLEHTRLLYFKEGRGSTVAVSDTAGVRSVIINGKIVASDHDFDLHHEYLLGHLPALLHPDPRSAAVVGLGAGITLGGIAAHESFERIVLVEIEPAVVGAAQQFADLHDDALNDPRVEQVMQDGRNYLATTLQTFDIVTADPIHPWTLGSTYLYTTEYFEMVRAHLNRGGVMCQWLPLYELSPEDVRSVIASFAGNFVHTTVWLAALDVLLIGSDLPIELDLDDLARRLRQPRVARQLARIGLDDVPSLLAEYLVGQQGVERFSEGAILNTDDNLYLEFSSPLRIGVGKVRANFRELAALRGNPAGLVRTPGAVFEPQTLQPQLERLLAAKAATLDAKTEWSAARNEADRARAVESARRAQGIVPEYRLARHVLAGCLSGLGELRMDAGEEQAALSLFEEAHALDSGNDVANFQLAARKVRAQEFDGALAHLEAALERKPHMPRAWLLLGSVLSSLGRFEDAVAALREAARRRPGIADTHALLGLALLRLQRFDEAIEELRCAANLDPDRIEAVTGLVDALVGAGRHREALGELREGLEGSPRRPLLMRLAWLQATSPDPEVRDGREARRMAVELTSREDARSLDVLAAALAELELFEEAVGVARRALALAQGEGREGQAREIQGRLEGYVAGRPYRE